MAKVIGPRVCPAFCKPVLALKPGLRTEVTVWPEPVQVQVTVPPRLSTTVSGLKKLLPTWIVAADTGEGGGGGGAGGPGGGGGGGGGLTVEPPPQEVNASRKRSWSGAG